MWLMYSPLPRYLTLLSTVNSDHWSRLRLYDDRRFYNDGGAVLPVMPMRRSYRHLRREAGERNTIKLSNYDSPMRVPGLENLRYRGTTI